MIATLLWLMVYVCLQSDLLYALLKRRSSVTDVCQLLSGS